MAILGLPNGNTDYSNYMGISNPNLRIMPTQQQAPQAVAGSPVAPQPTPVMATPSPSPVLGQTYATPQNINPTATNSMVPQTGLIGSEQVLGAGYNIANNAITNGTNNAEATFGNTAQTGTNANTVQADLSGANGPDAQKAAYANYQDSPALKYQMDQMQKATEQSAAAHGNLLGGNELLALQKNAAGIASQDFQNNFNNLGVVADRGTGVQARIADLRNTLGINKGQLATQTASQLSTGRTNAGINIANNVTNTANGISQLLAQQGHDVSGNMTNDINTIANLIHESGMGDKVDNANLAQILANISSGQATNITQGYRDIGDAKAAGTMGANNAAQSAISQYVKLGTN